MEPSNYIPTTKKRIYERIAEQDVMSKADLLTEFSITSSTLTRLLEEMLEQRFLTTSGLGPSSGGRKPILYEINASYGYLFGLEISRLYSTLGFFDMKMNPMSLVRWRMDEAMNPTQFIQHVHQYMRSILKDHRIEHEQVIGVGIGAVGPLDRTKGIILQPLYFPAKGWTELAICEMIETTTGFPAKLENGANTALIGEQWSVRHQNVQHMLYVHAGVGLRSAMMSYGRIVHGSIDMEGSVGQMIIQADGPRLYDNGNYGALEAFVSIQALEKQARTQAKMGRDHLQRTYKVSPEQINFDILVKALSDGEPAVREAFTQAATYLGIGLANLINMLHPEKIVLGGALVNSHELFYATAIDVANKNTYYFPAYQPQFSKGELKEDAVATGAALMIRKQLEI